jgi:hypothetical protein
VGRAATAARGAGRTLQQAQDVARAKENVESLRKTMEELEAAPRFGIEILAPGS